MKNKLFFKSRKKTLFLILMFVFGNLQAQTYNSTDYANQGDTVYVSKAILNTVWYNSYGIVWDFSALVWEFAKWEKFLLTQRKTGYSALRFLYIYNTNNVNLAQTNGQTITVDRFLLQIRIVILRRQQIFYNKVLFQPIKILSYYFFNPRVFTQVPT